MSSFLQSNAHFEAIGASLVARDEATPKVAQSRLQALQALNALTVAIQYKDPQPVYRVIDIGRGRRALSDGELFKALTGLRYQIEEHQIGRTIPATPRLFEWTGRKMSTVERKALKWLDDMCDKYATRVALDATQHLQTWSIE